MLEVMKPANIVQRDIPVITSKRKDDVEPSYFIHLINTSAGDDDDADNKDSDGV